MKKKTGNATALVQCLFYNFKTHKQQRTPNIQNIYSFPVAPLDIPFLLLWAVQWYMHSVTSVFTKEIDLPAHSFSLLVTQTQTEHADLSNPCRQDASMPQTTTLNHYRFTFILLRQLHNWIQFMDWVGLL